MIYATESMQPMATIEVRPLPSGYTDVWLRKDILGPLERDHGDGDVAQVYTAIEAYMRTSQAITQEIAEAKFDALWQEAAAFASDDKAGNDELTEMSAMLVDHEYRLILMELGV